jgi:NADH-quinone oxidoreductase subunit L
MDFALHLIPLIPLVAAGINLLIGRKLPRDASSLLAVGAVAGSALVATLAFYRVVSGEDATIHETWFTWIATGSFKVDAAFTMDHLSAIMTMVVTYVGLLIHIYSIGYMSHERDYARYFGYLNLFTGSMLLLVLGDNLLVSFIGWEGVGACSYLLIGFWYDKEANAYAGRKAFVVNRIGDFGFLLGIFLLIALVGTLNYSEIAAKTDILRHRTWLGMTGGFWVALLLFIGATGKSAQLPLYVWLPDAMAGPTPVSALIHAATMVTAGVYMVVRFSFLYALNQPANLIAPHMGGAVMVVGCATAFWAATMAFAQTDIKKVLAYSTISQLGFMFVGAAGATPATGIMHLMTHAFFKAGLFLGAGSVMHAMSDRTDIMEMGGLRKKLPYTHGTFLIYTLAIAGMPPLSGFWSKDAILGSAASIPLLGPGWHTFGTAIAIIMLAIAAMTSFYMFRLYFLVFTGECRADEHVKHHIHESPAVMTVPLVILAVLSIFGGALETPFHDWFGEFLGAAPELHIPWTMMALGSGAFLAGLALAAMLYYEGVREPVVRFVRTFPWLHKLVKNKFYVDELYNFVFVRPTKFFARTLATFFDKFIIDGLLVGGVARMVDAIGYVVRRVQNGDVQRYVAAMVIGAAAVLWAVSRIPSFDIGYTTQGGTVAVRVAYKKKPAGQRHLKYCWKIDGEDGCRSERAEDALSLSPGEHKLTLRVQDADWGTSSTESIKVNNQAPGSRLQAPGFGGGR